MPCEQAAKNVEAASGSVADDEGDRLVSIELCDRSISKRCGLYNKDRTQSDYESPHHVHHDLGSAALREIGSQKRCGDKTILQATHDRVACL
jgi:hypothetical protein